MPKRARPHDDTRHVVDQEKGRTQGAFHSLGVSPATSTRKPRSAFKRTKLSLDLTREQIEALPDDAVFMVNGNGRSKIALMQGTPVERKQCEPSKPYPKDPSFAKMSRRG